MDINQDLLKHSKKTQAYGLFLISIAYALFVYSSMQYKNFVWFEILFYSRIIAFLLALLFSLALLTNKAPKWFEDTHFYTLALAIQSLHGILESSSSVDFYSFTGVLYIIASLSVRSSIYSWLKRFFVPQFVLLVIPLFYKDKTFFLSLGKFVDTFSLPIAGFFLGTIVAIINAQKYDIFKKNVILEKEKSDFQHSLARQVAHDNRSPLSALNMVVATTKELPEEKRILIRNVSQRINDIANDLLEKGKRGNLHLNASNPVSDYEASINSPHAAQISSKKLELSTELLPTIVDTILSEKRIQLRDKIGVNIDSDFQGSFGAFVNINATELKRVLSNLINNSVEAFVDSQGAVTVSIRKYGENIILSVSDNGKGIPHEILQKLGEKGISFGKKDSNSGSGLGIYHAKTTIESFGGSLKIQSRENMGTVITMTLPSAQLPVWFASEIKLSADQVVVSVDDDISIHQIWEGRFKSIPNQKIIHSKFTSGEEFKKTVAQVDVGNILYLIDYEFLNQKLNGLDIISDLDIADKTILVTSRYEESYVRERAAKLGTKILPKSLAGFVPIST